MTKRANLKISLHLHERLKQQAARRHQPLQWFAEELLADGLKQKRATQPRELTPIKTIIPKVMEDLKRNG